MSIHGRSKATPSRLDLDFLASRLDDLALRSWASRLPTDPVRFPRRYEGPQDREVVALIAALFAYGNVGAIGAFLEGLLALLGPSPADVLRAGRLPRALPLYRFQTAEEIGRSLRGIGRVLARYGTLERAFGGAEDDAEARLEAFARTLRRACRPVTPGLAHLLPLPSDGSACKRWWLFLRWVVRPDDGVDLGLWTTLSPRDLRLPVDTHLARIARALGLTSRRTPDRVFALEATRALARICPEDPVRYDFTLAHLGISRECRGRLVDAVCSRCTLRPHCRLAGPTTPVA